MAEPTAVIVPVLGRPQHAAPFMASLRTSTGMAVVYAMCDAGDIETKDAWLAACADHVAVGSLRTFARKANAGYRASGEPWLLLAGSDVRFHPGWLDHAQAMARARGADVVGTNDLANARVLAGEHATHPLIRRAYVDHTGASWDGPGVVCHEGYAHMFVDDEIVCAAKARGVWAFARQAVVEHLHPYAGKADDDWVYQLGASHLAADRELFAERLARNGSGVTR